MLCLIAAVSSARTVGAGTCVRAQLSGSPAAVARVADELRHLGVLLSGDPGAAACRSIDATVEGDGDGIAVAIVTGGHASEGRVVGDARIAAAWIDSWLHDDNDFSPPPDEPVAAPIGVLAPPRDAPPATAPHPTSTMLDQITFAAGFERAYSGDGATWDGASVSACLHVGRVCAGARVRAAFQPESDVGPDHVSTSRSDLSALATASLAFPIGRMIVAPEVGLGAGRFATSRAASCRMPPPPGCDPSNPTMSCMPVACQADASGSPPPIHLAGESAASFGPRAAASVRLAIPLFDHVWLDGTAGVALSPLHADPRASKTIDPTTGAALPPLPGEPLATYQLGVGLRIGAP